MLVSNQCPISRVFARTESSGPHGCSRQIKEKTIRAPISPAAGTAGPTPGKFGVRHPRLWRGYSVVIKWEDAHLNAPSAWINLVVTTSPFSRSNYYHVSAFRSAGYVDPDYFGGIPNPTDQVRSVVRSPGTAPTQRHKQLTKLSRETGQQRMILYNTDQNFENYTVALWQQTLAGGSAELIEIIQSKSVFPLCLPSMSIAPVSSLT